MRSSQPAHRARAFLFLAVGVFAGASRGLLGVCGPFTDVAADAFCPFVLEIFYLGITTGTTATTYDPMGNVTRLQMAAFLSRTVDGVARKGGRRAALARFWSPQNETVLGVTTLAAFTNFPASDGLNVWVPNGSSLVSKVSAVDSKVLETWSGATNASSALSAIGKIFVTGNGSPGSLYQIDPRDAPGPVTTVANNLGNFPFELAFDGARIWTANGGPPASVSIVTPGASIPWTVTTVASGFSSPRGVLFDGTSVWVTDSGLLLKLDSSGTILQTVTVGAIPLLPVFDGANIWVPNFGAGSVSVVRGATGAVLATLTGNGLAGPQQAAFDGERVLVTDFSGDRVSLFKAADLSPIGFVSMGAASSPQGACSDGVNFWITFRVSQLARF